MGLRGQGLLIAAVAMLASSPASAREVYDDAYFVKPQATAAALFQDRNDCRREAQGLGGSAAAYTNPDYGAVNAMGSALDEYALHEGGLHKRLQRAVFNDCMKRRGWAPAELSGDEARLIAKASPRHPEPLDAWLKAHEPVVVEQPPEAPPPSSGPAKSN